ncbi:MAG TPA: J domain-containing protein [Candidatus Limnocylindria bacterium]|nr:J domain-containing protein [Candidatus Limnocylindria bacterium]
MEYRDYYAALGVPRNASQADIKKAFRKLARQHHPDVNKGDAAAERRFKEVNEAHAVLGDPEKRKAYDELGANWEMYQRAGAGTGRSGNPFAGSSGFPGGGQGTGVRFEYHGDPEDLAGFSEFFRTFFAGGASPFAEEGGRQPGATRRRVRVGSFDELFSDLGGAQPGFNGGRAAAGTAPRAQRSSPRYEAEAEISLGEVATGSKRLIEVGGRRIEASIPAGMADGQRIRLSGVGPDGADVLLKIKIRPHGQFTRRGVDLERELPLTLAEALLGAEVPVETLSGRVLLRIPPETQNGRTFRLAGKGLPRFRAEGSGNLLVKVKVVLPDDLDDRGRQLARDFLEHVRQPDPRTRRGPS